VVAPLQGCARFTQWPGRQTGAVAVAPLAIDHHDLHIPLQCVVLQAVVTQQHIARGRVQQRLTGLDPVRPGHHRQTGFLCQQHRLVAGFDRIAVGLHREWPVPGTPAVTAAKNTDPQTRALQGGGERDHQRRLAAAAGDQATDHHHGTIEPGTAQHTPPVAGAP
jgi:hypothetical protein